MSPFTRARPRRLDDKAHEAALGLKALVQSEQWASQRIEYLKIFALALLLRCSVATWNYSGYQKAPMYGDFEAQRHWMEVTTQLPATSWYFYDSDWWPLDYPPLTAYHSWMLGVVGTAIEPRWFALFNSRGSEDHGLKTFMRCTVVVSEYLILTPATLLCVRLLQGLHSVHDHTCRLHVPLAALILQPALIMIDHGHFQYNGVMLGFFMASIVSLLANRRLLACTFFVAALSFKQMALFYAPAMTTYLAGSCLTPKFRPGRLLAIMTVTLLSFAAVYAPLLFSTWLNATDERPISKAAQIGGQLQEILARMPPRIYPYAEQVVQSLHRIFPFSRGLFEDKVANIWCSIHSSGLYKFNSLQPATLSRLALGLTAASILPPSLIIFLRPRKDLILLACAASAWGFFLCGYQVHEKNVLLPILPMTALLAGPGGMSAATRAWVGFANVVATWTLYHLLIKDDLQMVYFPVLGIWMCLMRLPPFTFELYRASSVDSALTRWTKLVHLATYVGIAVWHVLQCFVPPPAGKPDLWIVINVLGGCGAFCLCYGWCLCRLIHESGLRG